MAVDHAWAQRLLLVRMALDPTRVPGVNAGAATQEDHDWATLFRRAIHPVCIRCGMAWMGVKLEGFRLAHFAEVTALVTDRMSAFANAVDMSNYALDPSLVGDSKSLLRERTASRCSLHS